MATKSYNTSGGRPKVLIGNWAEDRHWAESSGEAESGGQQLSKTRGRSTWEITRFSSTGMAEARSVARDVYRPPQHQVLPTRKPRSEMLERELWEQARAEPPPSPPKMDLNTVYQTTFTRADPRIRTTLVAESDEITYPDEPPVTVWSHKLRSRVPDGATAPTGRQPFARNSRFSQPIGEFVAAPHKGAQRDAVDVDPVLAQTSAGTSHAAKVLAEFRETMHPPVPEISEPAKPGPSGSIVRDDRLWDIVLRLKAALKRRGELGIRQLAVLFRRADRDRSGALSAAEFAEALRSIKAPLSEDDLRYCFRGFDRDHSGTLDYNEFLTGLRGRLDGRRLALVRQAFAKLDKNQSGTITVDDLRGTYSAKQHPRVRSGQATEDEVLAEFLQTFDCRDPDGVVTPEEWEQYYADMSASIDRDDYFELMMRQAWRL